MRSRHWFWCVVCWGWMFWKKLFITLLWMWRSMHTRPDQHTLHVDLYRHQFRFYLKDCYCKQLVFFMHSYNNAYVDAWAVLNEVTLIYQLSWLFSILCILMYALLLFSRPCTVHSTLYLLVTAVDRNIVRLFSLPRVRDSQQTML